MHFDFDFVKVEGFEDEVEAEGFGKDIGILINLVRREITFTFFLC